MSQEIRQNEKISYRIEGPFFIIHLINPDNLNALEGEDYIYLGELLELADRNRDVYFTIIQSSGRFFPVVLISRVLQKLKGMIPINIPRKQASGCRILLLEMFMSLMPSSSIPKF